MDKLIDLESVKQLVISTVKENTLTDEEIAECGAACGCGTTTADLGAVVQYLGDKKKKEKKEESPEDIDSKMVSFLNRIKEYLSSSDENLNTIEKVDKYQSVGLMLNDLLEEVGGLQELINLAKNGNTYAKEILEKFDLEETITTESTLEEDELDEMSRGILAPQEVAKREYTTQYPDMGVNTADQFLRKVILNPEAPGHKEYIDRLAYLIRNVSSDSQFSNIAADVQLNNEDDSDNNELSTSYANAVLGHRKSMSKSSYDSKGLINAYQRNVIKRGPYYKAGRDLVKQAIQSVGKNISDKYNEVDPAQSNKVLVNFFKGEDWKSLDDNQKIKEINVIKDEADLDEIGLNIVSKEEHNILDRLIGDDE